MNTKNASAVASLLVLATLTVWPRPSSAQQVSFTLEQANVILDSLLAREDWRSAYAIQTARLVNRNSSIDRYATLDSISQSQLTMCDSVRRKQYGEISDLRSENSALTRKVKVRGRTWPVMLAIGLIIGVLIN